MMPVRLKLRHPFRVMGRPHAIRRKPSTEVALLTNLVGSIKRGSSVVMERLRNRGLHPLLVTRRCSCEDPPRVRHRQQTVLLMTYQRDRWWDGWSSSMVRAVENLFRLAMA